jgi:hypothetical protein
MSQAWNTRPMPQISIGIAGQKKLAPVSAQMITRAPLKST